MIVLYFPKEGKLHGTSTGSERSLKYIFDQFHMSLTNQLEVGTLKEVRKTLDNSIPPYMVSDLAEGV